MTLTTHILDAEEQEISDLIESGTLTTVSNFTELKRDLMLSAREHIRRKPVTIRLQGSLLREIRAEAAKKWLPYQTYIQSALIQFIRQEQMK
jgi:predicted DNA binding CopG/RHH family protein